MSNSNTKSLSSENLTDEILREYQQEPRFKPFVTLLDLIENPKIDYTSPEVETFFNEIKQFGGNLEAPVPTAPEPRSEILYLGDPTIERIWTWDFSNWGKNVEYKPSYTFVIRSIAGVQKIVKWAGEKGHKIRVSGFRHTWSELYGGRGDVMIMFLPYHTLTKLPYKQPPADWKSELLGISLVPSVGGHVPPQGHSFCKIMAGTTNDQFRQWCFDNKTVCLPLSVIMVEVTFGGTNAPICHGSGLKTTTLSDLVVEVVYVDAKGNLQTINDPASLATASGAFGLLGVVVSITLQIEEMYVTDMMPVKTLLPLAIPPPSPDYPLPAEVQDMIEKNGITQQMLDDAQKEFIKRCENDYYLEWFWFPFQNQAWINTWSRRPKTEADANRQAYPAPGWLNNGVKSQQLQESIAEAIVNFVPFRWLSGRHQAFLLGASALFALPDVKQPSYAIKTFQSEALHFRRGIQNFRCWDTEWEIPIGNSTHAQRDYTLIQRAWWDGISAIYSRKDAPVRVALEMRLTGGSNVILAPQRGNIATASIEVLTTLITPKDDWATFMQVVADKWTSYPPLTGADGKVLYPRPHWAKQWEGLQVMGKPIEDYFRENAYAGAFEEFKKTFETTVKARGSSVDETLAMFGNDLMKRLIWGQT